MKILNPEIWCRGMGCHIDSVLVRSGLALSYTRVCQVNGLVRIAPPFNSVTVTPYSVEPVSYYATSNVRCYTGGDRKIENNYWLFVQIENKGDRQRHWQER